MMLLVLLSLEVAESGIFSSYVYICVKLCISDLELVLLIEQRKEGRNGPNIAIIRIREGTNWGLWCPTLDSGMVCRLSECSTLIWRPSHCSWWELNMGAVCKIDKLQMRFVLPFKAVHYNMGWENWHCWIFKAGATDMCKLSINW